MSEPVLRTSGISKVYDATVALSDASIELYPGEVHVLLGENGAGKSTLGKIIAGLELPSDGTIAVAGQTHAGYSIAQARAAGIEIVLQELSSIPTLTVAENIALGHERGFMQSRAAEAEEARQIIARLGLRFSPDTLVGQLSTAERQLLEIAKAARSSPAVIVMDEPSSRLTQKEREALYKIVRDLKAEGSAILFVTHHLNEALEIADRVSAMRDGRLAESRVMSGDVTEEVLVQMLVGKKVGDIVRHPPADPATLVTVDGLAVTGLCEDVTITIGKGEVVGIYGIVGCGREAVSRALVGLDWPARGSMSLRGRRYAPRSPREAILQGVAYLSGNRKESGILPQRSLVENLLLSSRVGQSLLQLISAGAERTEAEARLAELSVKFADAAQPITSLSGGNQQKILFGRALRTQPKLVVMEDPTAGIDIGAKHELFAQMQKLTATGTGVLLLSSDMRETISVCHRVYTMFSGRIIGHFEAPTEADEAAILADVMGSRQEYTHS